jgi:hypothetical protein
VDGGGLVRERPEEGHQRALEAELANDPDDHPVDGGVAADLEKAVGLQLGLEEGDEGGTLQHGVQVRERVYGALGRPNLLLHKQKDIYLKRTNIKKNQKKFSKHLAEQCCGSGMFIPDPTFFHTGSPPPDPHQRI